MNFLSVLKRRTEDAYASWKGAYAHLVKFWLLGFGLSLSLFQIFFQAHYSKFFFIDKSSIVIGTGDSGYW
jgi:hypothetical protein